MHYNDDCLLFYSIDSHEDIHIFLSMYLNDVIGALFDQWFFMAHTCNNTTTCNNDGIDSNFSSSKDGNWTRQQSKHESYNGKGRDDPILSSNVTGAQDLIENLLQAKSGVFPLAIPSKQMAEILASKFIQDLEEIAMEVRKTQSSLVKVGGDDYLTSISDKTLGMRFSESNVKNVNGDIADKTLVRIEWHTKTSIAQGRPPQVQKVSIGLYTGTIVIGYVILTILFTLDASLVIDIQNPL